MPEDDARPHTTAGPPAAPVRLEYRETSADRSPGQGRRMFRGIRYALYFTAAAGVGALFMQEAAYHLRGGPGLRAWGWLGAGFLTLIIRAAVALRQMLRAWLPPRDRR